MKSIANVALFLAAGMLATGAMAGKDGKKLDEDEIPNVLVIKIPDSKNVSGQDDQDDKTVQGQDDQNLQGQDDQDVQGQDDQGLQGQDDQDVQGQDDQGAQGQDDQDVQGQDDQDVQGQDDQGAQGQDDQGAQDQDDKDAQILQGQTSLDGAYVALLKVDLPKNGQGEVDFEKLAQMCDELEGEAEILYISDMMKTTDDKDIPDGIQQLFKQAEQEDEVEEAPLAWRVYTPFGSIGSGFYGYGYRPYYGYGYYSPWYSRYGYYYRGRPYWYNPSRFYRSHRGFHHYYYWR